MTEDGARKLRVVEGSKAGSEDLVWEYLETFGGRSSATVEAYGRILRQLTVWVAERPGGSDGFRPELLTRTAVEGFLSELESRGHSTSHRLRGEVGDLRVCYVVGRGEGGCSDAILPAAWRSLPSRC